MNKKNPWILNKEVLPQHVDHAGVMWHGSYLYWLEEARINALSRSGIEYQYLIQKGFEMPVTSLEIKYLKPISIGDLITIKSFFIITNRPTIKIKSYFLNKNNDVLNKSNINLVLIKKLNFSIVRTKPTFLLESLEKLNSGPN